MEVARMMDARNWNWSLLVSTVWLGMFLAAFGASRGLAGADSVERSLKLEAQAGIRRSLRYLAQQQKEDGSWQDHPAITGLVITGMLRSGREEFGVDSEPVRQGLDYIRGYAQPDGGIYDEYYASYSTSICVMTLLEADRDEDQKIIEAARRYLLEAQADESEDIQPADRQYGGWGYERHYSGEGMHRADMSNTQFALSALHALEEAWREATLRGEREKPREGELPQGPCRAETKLAYRKAIRYLERCQNDDGGFIYRPGESKAGKAATGGLRSYGSMTYAGLKSMIYARLEPDDPRVRAAYQWATNHWTLKENPGMGQQGLYYYYQTMAKGLDAYGREVVVDAGGNEHRWRSELTRRLLDIQRANGSWANESGRWMETIPELVTAYSVLALDHAISN
jgi:squalene-hopene/tetraprenyl-beta-curcumene cyclase